jgi:hypothetical protein
MNVQVAPSSHERPSRPPITKMSKSPLHDMNVQVAPSSHECPSLYVYTYTVKYRCGIPTNMFQSPERTNLFICNSDMLWLVSELCSTRAIDALHYAPVHVEGLRSPDTYCTTWRILILWKDRTFQKTRRRGIHGIFHTKITTAEIFAKITSLDNQNQELKKKSSPTQWSRIRHKKLTIVELIRKVDAYHDAGGSLPCSHDSATRKKSEIHSTPSNASLPLGPLPSKVCWDMVPTEIWPCLTPSWIYNVSNV